MSSFRPALVAVALAVAIAGMPSASAGEIGAGGGSASANGCSNLHCYTAVLTVTVEPLGNTGWAQVVWNCQATSTVDPSSTSISVCSVNSHNAPPVSLPGPFAATADTTTVRMGSELSACVGGQASFLETIEGAQTVSASGCDPILVAAVPVN